MIHNVVNDSGTLRSVAAETIYRFPTGGWNAFSGADAALVFLDPTSTGAGMGYLSAWTNNYTNASLNVYQGATDPNLLGVIVAAYGYGGRTATDPFGKLNVCSLIGPGRASGAASSLQASQILAATRRPVARSRRPRRG